MCSLSCKRVLCHSVAKFIMLHQPLDVGEKLFISQVGTDWKSLLTESYESDILDLVSAVLMDDPYLNEVSVNDDPEFLEKEPRTNARQGAEIWQMLNVDPPAEKTTSTDYSDSPEVFRPRLVTLETQPRLSSSFSAAKAPTLADGSAAKTDVAQAAGDQESSPNSQPMQSSEGKRKRTAGGDAKLESSTKICKMHRWTHEDVMQLIWFWCEASLEPTIEHSGARVKKWRVINENFGVGRPWSSEARIQAYFKTKVKGLYNFRVIYNHMLKHNTVPDEYDQTIYREKPSKS